MPPPGLAGPTNSGQKRKSTKSGHSRSYPRGVGLDFRKLGGLTLVSYIDHHGTHTLLLALNKCLTFVSDDTYLVGILKIAGVQVRPEAPPSELAVAVARHFESLEVDEEACIGGFLEKVSVGTAAPTEYARTTQFYDGFRIATKRRRARFAARPGEQVAAKVSNGLADHRYKVFLFF